MNRRSIALAALLAAACSDAPSRAAPPARPPCSGCTLDVPAKRGARPLLVVMHGDREQAEDAAARWRDVATARGWAVLSLQCPRERGCSQDSWYKWGGAPEWVHAQVAEVARQVAIDPRRIYLAGWSGGATYIGMNAVSWPRRFAAVVFHGGGQPPDGDGCPTRELPAYFLVGDRNPAHPAAKRLRGYFERCRQELRWDLIEDANHAQEDAALDRRKATAILDWLEDRSRARQVSAVRRPVASAGS
jgi:poly(3-hydroxybutyrate) depolymerase